MLPALGIILVCAALAALLPIFTAVSGIRFPRRLVAGVFVFALTALLFGEVADGYEKLPWWDLLLHAVSAAALSIVGMGLALLPTAGGRARTAVWMLAVLAFGFSMMVGTMWEILEFTLDRFFGFNTQVDGHMDTMTDTIANLVGAVYGAAAAHLAVTFGRRPPPAGVLLDFVAANPVIFGAWQGPSGGLRGEPCSGEAGTDRPLERRGQARSDMIPGE
ncbi:hypothetical protein [uncultured Jannaschia sp.]|uniref:hypothetical protein n=1 Tax=uncultured Jannaschia sp. TaxID=293347 RepID=UPI00260D335E|nr:hypothetical protein [uncultured Jannaschia sp.]